MFAGLFIVVAGAEKMLLTPQLVAAVQQLHFENAWILSGAADPACKIAARASFRNEAKLNAILGVAAFVHELGFQVFKTAVVGDPIRQLSRLPFIGPVTVWHLAKVLGLNAAKPDRHLMRLSSGLGFRDAEEFCAAIAEVSGEEAKVIDLIIWRSLADTVSSPTQVLRG